jgi:hypothetical protein
MNKKVIVVIFLCMVNRLESICMREQHHHENVNVVRCEYSQENIYRCFSKKPGCYACQERRKQCFFCGCPIQEHTKSANAKKNYKKRTH